MRNILRTAAAVLFICATAAAQYTTVTASNIRSSGALLAQGRICMVGTDAHNNPISYQIGGGGTQDTTPICKNVINGVIQGGGLVVPDSSLTSPLNVCERTTVTNYTTGATVVYYPIAGASPQCGPQPRGATWSLDSYSPNVAPLAIVQTGPQGPPGVSCSNIGSLVAWDSVTAYTVGQCSSYLGDVWLAIQANTNQVPADESSYWARVSMDDHNEYYISQGCADLGTCITNASAVGATHIVVPAKVGGGCWSSSQLAIINTPFSVLEFKGGACVDASNTSTGDWLVGNGVQSVTIMNPDIRPVGAHTCNAAGLSAAIHFKPYSYFATVIGGNIGSAPNGDNATDQFCDGVMIESSYYAKVFGTDAHGNKYAGFHLTNGANAAKLIAISSRGSNVATKYQQYGALADDSIQCSNPTSIAAYSAATTYSVFQCVSYSGFTWMSLVSSNLNHTPTDGAGYWGLSNNTDGATIDCTACEGNTIADSAALGADGTFISPGHQESIGGSSLTGTITCTPGSTSITGVGTSFLSQVIPGQNIKCAPTPTPDPDVCYQEVLSVNSDTSITLAANYPSSGYNPNYTCAGGSGVAGKVTAADIMVGILNVPGVTPNCSSVQTHCAIGTYIAGPTLGGSQATPVGIHLKAGSANTRISSGELREPVIVESASTANFVESAANSGLARVDDATTRWCVGTTCNRVNIAPNFTSGQSPLSMVLPVAWNAGTQFFDVRDSSGNIIMQIFTGQMSVPGLSGGSAQIVPGPTSNGNLVLHGTAVTNSVYAQGLTNQSAPAFIAQCGSSQTGAAQEWRDSGGGTLAKVDCSGNVSPGNGSNVVYRCATAGAVLPVGSLTIDPTACGTTTDTGLRVK